LAEITFGTDGWRSTVDTDFNEDNVAIVAQGICNYLHKKDLAHKGCVVAYDTRAHSETFADVVAGILSANGIATLKTQEFCPTPMAAFAVRQERAAGAIMLTASHNPPRYNGIKFIPHYSGPATPDITDAIVEEIEAIAGGGGSGPPGGTTTGPLKTLDVSSEYVEQLLSLIDGSMVERSGIKVVFDPMYGAGQHVFMKAIEKLGLEASALNCELDPEFGGRLPDPTEKNLDDLKQSVADNRADIGVALDGDADRFGVIDSRGTYLTPNRALSLILWYLLDQRSASGDVARTVATTHMLDTIAEQHNRKVLETPVGFKYIGELMRTHKIVLGGEESGGMSIAGHIPEKDGLIAGLILIEIVARFKKPLSELLENVYHELGPCFDERIDVPISNEVKEALMAELREAPPAELAGEKVEKVDLRDGVKVITAEQTWMLVRPSGTEPMVRVYIEARSREAFDGARESALGIVKGR
jgi:alpha-D-glucose phosphate-specific phosphoglucomutase